MTKTKTPQTLTARDLAKIGDLIQNAVGKELADLRKRARKMEREYSKLYHIHNVTKEYADILKQEAGVLNEANAQQDVCITGLKARIQELEEQLNNLNKQP